METLLLIASFIVFLLFISHLLFRSILAPLGVYSLLWGVVVIVAYILEQQGEYSFHKEIYYMFLLGWVSFVFGCIFLYLIEGIKVNFFNRVLSDEILGINIYYLRNGMIFLSIIGLIFSICYFYEMFSLIKGMEKEMIRHFVYALSGEISTQIFTRKWYIYNLGIAIIILSSFFAATYISVVKDKKSFERLISYIPFVSVILFILPEMSRGRLLDVILIYTFIYLFLRYTKFNFLKILHKDYKLLLFLSTILIVPTALITKTRGIVFSENLILNVFYQVENYFAVSIIAFNESLTSFQQKIGMRAILYPAYYLLERIGIIPVGSNVDPTQLTEFITYPTPTYLYWLHSGYGWFGIITVSFFIGIISTYFYMMFMRNRNIGSLWFLVSSYLVILASYATWRLYDLWFWIVLCLIIPITKLVELGSPLRQDR